ncbi:hypothetical protein MNBD_GAMMA22-438 [hydrothermal vent metagenome]|uniref:Uncharacterized protein n=1 Tax=hydrothermal vent metagenome TaxID=652676 RepID=A0A3B1BAY8_9ZZZZ
MVSNVHFLYAIHNKNEYIKMKKSSFILLFVILFQFSFSSISFSANKSTSTKYLSTLKKAKAGSPKAMFLVGRMLEKGKGTKKNLKQASKWYQRSSSQNYAAANARLGKLYLEGISVRKNPKKAFKLLNLAAVQGIPSAQFNLALVYEIGVGTKKDLQRAIKWYNSAAKNGYFAAKSKSRKLKKQLGITNSLASIETENSDTEKNTTLQGIGEIDEPEEALSEPEIIKIDLLDEISNQESTDAVELQYDEQSEFETESETESETEDDEDITEDPVPVEITTSDAFTSPVADIDIDTDTDSEEASEPEATQDELATEHQVNPKITESEEQALLSNTFDRTESQANNKLLAKAKITKKQKLDLIKNEHIRRTLKTLLEGRWFNKNRPVNFLPSPKTICNIINKSDIKCISRQLQRQTEQETVYYKTLSKISRLTSRGSFLIQYQNTVVRVVPDNNETTDEITQKSKVKIGLQKLIHQLNCQYKNISNLICVRDKTNTYNFKNRAILNKNSDKTVDVE